VLQEPTAAAIYHTWLGLPGAEVGAPAGNRTFLVYDLGGGTFDVSVLRTIGGEYQVLAIDGDNFLGGDDFDRRFAEKLRKDLAARGYALDLDVQGDPEDAARFQRLVHLAQEIKEGLSTSEVLSISRADLLVDKTGEPVSIEAEIGRADYEATIRDLVESTIVCAERALARSQETAGVGLADLDAVVLVGGSTRVPLVGRLVAERLCARTRSKAAPLQTEVDTIVALGAAIFAAQKGGLRLSCESAQVLVTSPLVGRSARLELALTLERVPEGARRVEVRDASGAVLAEADASCGASVRLDVPLSEGSETPTTLALVDLDDRALATLPLTLYRGTVRARASALSQPTVVAKDISVEITRGGRRDRKVLIPRGASLPIEVTHELATGDRSGAVVLRLLQNRLPIKTLMLEVSPELPLGTPVALTLRCDEAMRLEARAVVAGAELWARVEPPAQETDTTREAIDALLTEAESTAKGLWGRDAHAFRRELEPLATGLREVVGTDPDKVAALVTQLRTLVDHFAGSGGDDLSPPLHRFEGLLDGIRRLVYGSGQGGLLGLSMEAWDKRIDELATRGAQAYEARDAAAWRRVHNEAQALYETAATALALTGSPDDPERLARMRLDAELRLAGLDRKLEDFVASANEDVRHLQLAERDRLLAQLRDRITPALARATKEGTAADLRRELERLHDELSRVETALERLPSLGLVTDRR
jgi:molecular chaperone DnaK